jgi:hypothetical protein
MSEPMPETTSQKQIAANQANARKSTGPKTPEGRAISKMNALKNGIFSKEALVRGMNLKENRRELAALHERFRQEYHPVGPVEEMLVDQIVAAQWRLRRVLRAESAEIALSVDGGHWARTRADPNWPVTAWHFAGDPIHAMRDSALGSSLVEGWLREVREQVDKKGGFSEAALEKFRFEGKSNGLWARLKEVRRQLSENSTGADDAVRREANKKEALRVIDRELTFLEWSRSYCEKREAAEEEARQAAAVLPAPEVLDKIVRYETTLQRQLYRALAQLERMQRMRQGEAVPAPMMMEVSERA